MERLAQFVSDSFDAKTTPLDNPPHHHLQTPSSSSASSSSVPASSAAGTLSPTQNVDVEAVDEDGSRPAAHLSHGIRHIILQQQSSSSMNPQRRHPSIIVSACSLYISMSSVYTVGQKTVVDFNLNITLVFLDRFLQLLHHWKQE